MLDEFLRSLNTWCGQRQDLLGLLLIGSYARGTAKPDSDVDLILISMQPLAYVDNCRWAEVFGAIKKAELEDWGLVKSWRIIFQTGLEVEFGITDMDWLSQEQLQGSTGKIIADGAQIIFDPRGELAESIRSVKL
ncbi:MAG: hypothetical protein EKK48_25540 [Candidatus Melainabacteria bacterium]|nr:MAG: hypothetical protein EKK48_25540 [Candidatus Melainabacteria bacterium]